MRGKTSLAALIVCAAFVNAVPSIAELHPFKTLAAPVDDDLMGSGYEGGARALKRKAEHPAVATTRAIRAILAARMHLLGTEPALGQRLLRDHPALERDDTVETMVARGDAIRFNRDYVMGLTPHQLVDHLARLASRLDGDARA